MTTLSDFKTMMRSPQGCIQVNNAGMGPLLPLAKEAMDRFDRMHFELGAFDIDKTIMSFIETKTAMSRFLGGERDGFAWVQNCATALSQVALGLDYQSDDELIVIDQEYPSSIYAWMAAAEQHNLKLHRIASQPDFSVDFENILRKLNQKTKVVALSWVQYQTGTTAPLETLAKKCHEVDALLVVDVIQGVGVIPFHFGKSGADIAVGSGHKWLCGPLGMGYLQMKPELVKNIQPILHGAATYGIIGEVAKEELIPHQNADRFEHGCCDMAAAFGMVAAAQFLESIGLGVIHQEALRLATKLSDGLGDLGFEVLRHKDSPSPITTFRSTTKSNLGLEAAQDRLYQHKIPFAGRAGGLRLSPHAFNTDGDIDVVLQALAK